MITSSALLAALFAAAPAGERKPAPAPGDIRVMSFNLRYGTAKDGENHWDKRKDLVVEVVRAFDPDLLGTQETLAFQRDHLLGHLEGYDAFGVARDDGGERGEMTTVLWKKARFERVDGGTFWLSDTPDKVGTKGWDASLPRICTWVKLRDLLIKDAPPLYFYNTHFDHRGPTARTNSAKLLRKRVTGHGTDARVILTGDFNADEGSEPYKAVFGESEGKASPLRDTLRVFKPVRGDDEGSFNSFTPNPGKARIDWIGVTSHWTVLSAAIDRTRKDGRWPSDHFPVTAVVRAK